MAFLERVDQLVELHDTAWPLALRICAMQRTTGDFRLKTCLALVTSDLLTLCEGLFRKLGILDLGLDRPARRRPDGAAADARPGADGTATLSAVTADFAAVCARVERLNHGLAGFIDLKLRTDCEAFLRVAGRDQRALQQWCALGPTPVAALRANLGLVRDCVLFEATALRDPTTRPPRPDVEALRDPRRRAGYFSVNAYLELESIDIVCDLLLRVWQGEPPGFRSLAADLNKQLLDEARHAELLAGRVEALGLPVGCAPVCLQTWHIYDSFDTLAERLIAQQVLQEAVALDASADNVIRMAAVGDRASAEVYAQITADEKTHVELGLRWAARLAPRPLPELMQSIWARIDERVPFPSVPIAVELRHAIGYPRDWVIREVEAHGALSIDRLQRALTGGAAAAAPGEGTP